MRQFLPVCLVAIVVIGCTAISQQKAIPASPDQLQFKNLKVLPPTITHDQLVATMRNISRSLGTRCEHCHVQTATEPKEVFDFASDAKPEKNVARTMMRMTAHINADYVSKVNENGLSVACSTCHRGKTVPENWQPPAPPAPAAPAAPAPPAPAAPVPKP
ncbi:MAG: c-type cytochrome [Thermoanaerobaculia bacterium]